MHTRCYGIPDDAAVPDAFMCDACRSRAAGAPAAAAAAAALAPQQQQQHQGEQQQLLRQPGEWQQHEQPMAMQQL